VRNDAIARRGRPIALLKAKRHALDAGSRSSGRISGLLRMPGYAAERADVSGSMIERAS
jgi:hypothetical protein